jgi:hypothetical protein
MKESGNNYKFIVPYSSTLKKDKNFIRNVGEYLPEYTVSHPRGHYS